MQGARPVFFEANGGVQALYMYLMAPAIAMFGRTLLAARLVAVLCSLAGMAAMHALLRRLIGPVGSLLAVATMSVSFWHLFSSRVALEPITVPLVGALALYCLWRGLAEGRRLWFAAAGTLIGLAMYTYHSGPLTPLAVAAFALYLALWHRRAFARRFGGLVLCAVVAAMVAAPLLVHLATRADVSSARVRDLAVHVQAATQGDLAPLAGDAAAAAGMFGWQGDPEWRYNLAGRPVFDPLGAALFYCGFVLALRRFRHPAYAMLVIWLLVNLIFSAITPPSPSSLRAIGAVVTAFAFPAISVMWLWQWMGLRGGSIERGAVTMVTAGWLIVSGAVLMRDYFVVWANTPEVRAVYRADLAEAARYLDATDAGDVIAISAPYAADLDRQSFEMVVRRPHQLKWFDGRNALLVPAAGTGRRVSLVLPASGGLPEVGERLIGGLTPTHAGLDPRGDVSFIVYRLSSEQLERQRALCGSGSGVTWAGQVTLTGAEVVSQAAAGGATRVIVCWEVRSELQPPDGQAPTPSLHLTDDRGETWAQADYQAYMPSQWSKGDRVASWFDVPVTVDTPPGRYEISLAMAVAGAALPAHDGSGAAVPARVNLGQVEVGRGPVPTGTVDLHIRFPRRQVFGPIRLLGANATETAVAGSEWLLRLYWQSIAPTGEDLQAVVRLYGNADELVYEWRTTILEGVYPTSRWRVGEYLRSDLYVPLPAGLLPSKGRVRVNVYDAAGKPLGTEPGISVVGLAVGATGR